MPVSVIEVRCSIFIIEVQSPPGQEPSNFVLQGGFVLHLITCRACRFNPLDDQVRFCQYLNVSFPLSDEDSKPVLIFSFNPKSQARRQRGGEVRVSWGWGGTEGGWQLCHSLTLEHQGNLHRNITSANSSSHCQHQNNRYHHHRHQNNYHHLDSTALQAGAGPDLEAVCYATNEVLGADSVTTCLHKKDIKSVTCHLPLVYILKMSKVLQTVYLSSCLLVHLSTYERYQKCYKQK